MSETMSLNARENIRCAHHIDLDLTIYVKCVKWVSHLSTLKKMDFHEISHIGKNILIDPSDNV